MSDHFTQQYDFAREINSNYIPSIVSLYSLFEAGAVNESSANDLEQQRIKFRSVTTLGEVIAAPVSEQSTEINRFKSGSQTKDYVKYLNAISWQYKGLAPTYENFATISQQALNKLKLQEDKEFITGRDSYGTQRNNGLLVSSDPDFTAVAVTTPVPTTLAGLKSEFETALDIINETAPGEKYILAWGAVKTALNTFASEQSTQDIKNILVNSIDGITFPRILTNFTNGIESAVTGDNGGYVIISPNAVRMHYCRAAQVFNTGYDSKNLEIYANFVYGSRSLEVLAKNGIYKKIFNN